jgi:predicted HAD superfamily Cof-like phosphohydrolase
MDVRQAQAKVLDFHLKHGHFVGRLRNAEKQSAKVRLLRSRLVAEEAAELVAALHENDVEKIADAIGDLLYVTLGTAVAYGMPAGAIFDEVHASNMTKSAPNKHGKGGKRAGFRKPDIAKVLRAAVA